MASEYLPDVPTTPSTDDDWEALVNRQGAIQTNFNSVSLTNWAAGNTSRPLVAAGSQIEVAGGVASFTTDTTIVNEGGLSSGTVYLKIDVSGATPVPTFTNTAPTWDDAKGGWYDGSGNRYTNHLLTWNGASSYTEKGIYSNINGGLSLIKYVSTGSNLAVRVDGNLDVTNDIEEISTVSSITSGTTITSTTTTTAGTQLRANDGAYPNYLHTTSTTDTVLTAWLNAILPSVGNLVQLSGAIRKTNAPASTIVCSYATKVAASPVQYTIYGFDVTNSVRASFSIFENANSYDISISAIGN